MKGVVLTLLGAVVGGILGYFGFVWMAHHGLYALILPGGAVGIGAGLFRNQSISICLACGLLALAVGLFTEWHFAPFVRDGSLGYFITHVHQLSLVTLVMIVVGAVIGFWGPFSRVQAARKANAQTQ